VRPYVLVDDFGGKNAESSSVESTAVVACCRLSTGWILLVDVLFVRSPPLPKACDRCKHT